MEEKDRCEHKPHGCPVVENPCFFITLYSDIVGQDEETTSYLVLYAFSLVICIQRTMCACHSDTACMCMHIEFVKCIGHVYMTIRYGISE